MISPQATPVIYVLVSIDSVPSPPDVFTKPLDVKLDKAGIEADPFAVIVEKLPVVEYRLVELAVVL